jgi:uridylate kinase
MFLKMETLIFSVGGSIIAPDKPDYFFIREFKNFVLSLTDKYRIIIVCGGGKTNSYYNEAASRVSNVKKADLDWIGIMATRLNAELVRCVFGELSYETVIYDPTVKIETGKRILIAAGWKPGCSTDYDSVLLAKNFEVRTIVNLTNISYVYDKDPSKFKDAKKLFNVTWKEYRKIVGDKWTPRLNSPFDPIASKEAEKMKLKVAVMKGTDLKNLKDYLDGKSFIGTIIE